jgi:hypothetical protein
MTPELYAEKAKSLHLMSIIVDEKESCIKSGAVYVYSADYLNKLLERSSDILIRNDWPSDNEGFIRTIARNWVEDGHPVMPIIREAFGDR